MLLSGVSTDFRTGFTDRRLWPAPREGEAYSYTRVSNWGHVIPYANLGYMGTFGRKSRTKYEGSYEFGIRWLRFSELALEQGFDRFNMRAPRRTFINRHIIPRSYYVGFKYNPSQYNGDISTAGFFMTVFFIPSTPVGFDEFGQAHLNGAGVSMGVSIRH